MTQAVPTVQMLSSANEANFEKNEVLSAQYKKLCLSVSLIVIGALLILGSLALICMLLHFGMLVPGLALLVVPVLVGLVLIALGVYELHTKSLLLERCHLKEIYIPEKPDPSKVPLPKPRDTVESTKVSLPLEQEKVEGQKGPVADSKEASPEQPPVKEKPLVHPKPKVIPPLSSEPRPKKTIPKFYQSMHPVPQPSRGMLAAIRVFEPNYPEKTTRRSEQ